MEKNKPARHMPSSPEPYWRDSVDLPTFSKLEEDLTVDVAIVGGGITGITSGYLLAKQGLKVAILEASTILNGTTGHTTAKVTAQHSNFYDELIQHVGLEQAKLYYQANDDALRFIRQLVQTNNIPCDFAEEDAYIYTTSKQNVAKINKEMEAYRKLGIEGEYRESIPFNIDVKAALVMKKQAQFHPLQYLNYLLKEYLELGGKLFEHTVAVDIEEGNHPRVVTKNGKGVTSSHVLICSHFPFFDGRALYFARMYAERAYIIGVKTKQDFPGGMYLSIDSPSRSLRYTHINGEKLVLVSGEGHKTGQSNDTHAHYTNLEIFAEQTLGIEEYMYRWSTQDLYTLDKIPYIGQHSSYSPNILVATGFKKWGMTSSTVAAQLFSDIIHEKDNPYLEVFSPLRFHSDPSIKNFLVQNIDVAGHLLSGKIQRLEKSIHDLNKDEGAVINFYGERAGAYMDKDGEIHVVDTTCTHMGCEVEWNDGERTWDCPCHGSRFSIDGEVIEGPAEEPLRKLRY